MWFASCLICIIMIMRSQLWTILVIFTFKMIKIWRIHTLVFSAHWYWQFIHSIRCKLLYYLRASVMYFAQNIVVIDKWCHSYRKLEKNNHYKWHISPAFNFAGHVTDHGRSPCRSCHRSWRSPIFFRAAIMMPRISCCTTTMAEWYSRR